MDQDRRALDFVRLLMPHEQEIQAYVVTLVPHVHDLEASECSFFGRLIS